MYYSIWYDLSIIVPELNLIFGALLFLLFGAYAKKSTLKYICYGACVLMIAAIYHIYANPVRSTTLFGGMLVIDEYTSVIKIFILVAAIAVMLMLATIEKNDKYITFEMPVLMMLSTAGMMFLVSSKNLLSLYLSLELMSLPLYIMAAYNRNDQLSSEAGLKYFVLGALSSGLYLFGASLLYGFTGFGEFDLINSYCLNNPFEPNNLTGLRLGILVGGIFILVSLFFKTSAAPFHMWAPDVYQGSPTIVTTFFASLPKVAVLGLLGHLLFEELEGISFHFQNIIIFVSVVSMFVGAFGAIMQKNLKRLLAYSSISHVGFALMGVVNSGTRYTAVESLRSLIIYLVIYLSLVLGIFACLLILKKDGEYKENISDLSGLAKKYPYLAFAIATLMFSLAGIPPFAGFFAKFYVLYAVLQMNMYLYSLAAVVASVISAFYYLRVVKVMYFDQGQGITINFFPFTLKVILAIMVIFNILYVALPAPLVTIAEQAVKAMLDYHE